MSDTTSDVLGIGNAIVDVLSREDDAFLETHDIPKGAMHLIDEAQAANIYGAMGPGIEISGGSAANTVAGLASFGGAGAFVGKVRDDQLGDVFAHDIRSIGCVGPVGNRLGFWPVNRSHWLWIISYFDRKKGATVTGCGGVS